MPLAILIVGGGSIGERHLRCFQQIGCEVALCETNAERRGEVAAAYDLAQTFGTIDQAAAETWDGVVICTPANWHVDHAAQLAPRAQALLIEKPLCTRLEDVARLRAATMENIVQVAYVLRAHPAIERAKALLAGDEIGPLHQITIVAGQHFPTFRPAYREIYYARHASGGGAVQDAATHLFDLVQHLAGPLDWIFCDYAHQQLEGVEVEDTVHFLGRAAGEKVLVSLALNQFMAPNETHVQLNGAGGSICIRFHEQRVGVFKFGDKDWSWSEPLVKERDDLFRGQAERFLAAAAGKQSPLCTLDEAVHTLRVNLAALASGRTRAPVQIQSS